VRGIGLVDLPGSELAEEFLFVHAVFEGLIAFDEDYRNLVGELAVELGRGVDVDFFPGETIAAGELGERFFDHLAEVTASSGIKDDVVVTSHGAEV
jgi:hypothetical protein